MEPKISARWSGALPVRASHSVRRAIRVRACVRAYVRAYGAHDRERAQHATEVQKRNELNAP